MGGTFRLVATMGVLGLIIQLLGFGRWHWLDSDKWWRTCYVLGGGDVVPLSKNVEGRRESLADLLGCAVERCSNSAEGHLDLPYSGSCESEICDCGITRRSGMIGEPRLGLKNSGDLFDC